MDIKNKGNPNSKVWVITEKPFEQDKAKGFIFSAGYGYVFDKMMQDAGIPDYYVVSRRSDPDDTNCFTVIENHLNHYKPPIIIPLEETGKFLCPQLNKLRQAKKGLSDAAIAAQSDIDKYIGSLLISEKLNYPHYVIPSYSPDTVVRDWKQRDIITSIDFGKIKLELKYFLQHGSLKPLKPRKLISDDIPFDELLHYLDSFISASLLSNDIETVYPKTYGNKKSFFQGHPGYPVVVGLADSSEFGISFNLFREHHSETVKLWKVLQQIFLEVPQLGQNFFMFDIHYYQMLGFRMRPECVHDTLIRQHILWPELPKTLQFMTRQYTREPYYKDEGHGWSMKQIKKLKHYNCLDVCVTFEVFEQQELDFKDRPYLKG